MAHMIDMSNSRANVAFANEVPWHGLGRELTPDADIETWRREAGLEFEVKASPVLFDLGEDKGPREFVGRNVLYRDDTKKPLSVMSKQYNIVQPGEILDFIAACVKHSGFQMEVAGSLDDGKRVWALAKVNDGAPVIGHDVVRPYLLAATSYDGTMSTTFKFTAIRVVCNNTITMAAGRSEQGQTEKDKVDGPVVQCVRVPHSDRPDFERIRQDLGIVLTAWDRFLVEARMLADTKVNEEFSVAFLKALLPTPKDEQKAVEETRAFQRLMAIVKGEEPSATLPEARGTAWGLLNDVTWYVDHVRGTDAKRLSSAWFGSGDAMKDQARELLLETIEA